MGEQMQEYAVSQVLHWFRRFDDYRIQQNSSHWQPLPEYHREDFTIGILGAGVLGSKVAQSLQTWRFPLRCWSRTRKSWLWRAKLCRTGRTVCISELMSGID